MRPCLKTWKQKAFTSLVAVSVGFGNCLPYQTPPEVGIRPWNMAMYFTRLWCEALAYILVKCKSLGNHVKRSEVPSGSALSREGNTGRGQDSKRGSSDRSPGEQSDWERLLAASSCSRLLPPCSRLFPLVAGCFLL